MNLIQILLKGLGKVKVRSILNKWIKNQINDSLENNYTLTLSSVIWLEDYANLKEYQLEILDGEPMEVDDLFKFIGNKI
jgi:hypothetical protein